MLQALVLLGFVPGTTRSHPVSWDYSMHPQHLEAP